MSAPIPVATRVLFAGAMLVSLGEVALADRSGLHAPVLADPGWLWIAATLAGAAATARWAAQGRSTSGARDRLLLVPALVIAIAAWTDHLLPGSVTHGKILPGAMALAMLLAGRGGPALAPREAAAGVIAASYALAGIAKWIGAGSLFLDPSYLGLLLAERSVDTPELLSQLRLAVASSPAACTLLGAGALLAELGGVTFLWPKARVPYAIVVTSMHIGIALLMGYVYVGWVCAVWAIALWSPPAVDSDPASL